MKGPDQQPVSPVDHGDDDAREGPTFAGGAYRANLYVYDAGGRRLNWYVIRAESVAQGRYFTLGRSPDCNIPLDDGASSSRHAYIAGHGEQLLLRDMDSTNGTEINGEPVEEAVLCHGDVIRIGTTDVRFLYSYREPPIRLVLDFLKGPNAGKSVTNYTSSATIGRANCSVNLPGTGVAPQHVRVDAFGRQLCYVVNLRAENYTWLNDRPVVGLVEAREGDTLRVGEHEMRLRVQDDPDLLEQVPQGEGTLEMVDISGVMSQRESGKQLALRASAIQRKLDEADLAPDTDEGGSLPAHLLATGDQTAMDMSSSEAFQQALDQSKALREGESGESGRVGSGPNTMGTSSRSIRSVSLSAAVPADWGEHPPVPVPEFTGIGPSPRHIVKANRRGRNARRSRSGGPGVAKGLMVLLVLLGLAVGALAFIPVTQQITLGGELGPGESVPLPALSRGRIEQVFFRLGDKVVAGDLVVRLIDLDTQDELDDLAARIDALEQAAARRVGQRKDTRRPANEVKSALGRAERALEQAEANTRARLAAFNRREGQYDDLEAARIAEEAARKKITRLRLELDEARRAGTKVVADDLMADIAKLISRKEALQANRRREIKAPRAGLLLRAEGRPVPHEGQRVSQGETLFRVGDVNRLNATLRVPGRYLGAVETAGQATLAPEGLADVRLPVALGRPSDVAIDGAFPLVVEVSNASGRLRPGQRVEAQVALPSISALSWLLARVQGE